MEHRNLIAALCMISAFILPINAELKYVDASRLTLIGKVMPTPENVYHRVDTVKYNDMPFQVKRLFTHSAGLVVSFKTNSPTVAARWTTKGKGVMGNVTPICDRGLDLYMNDGGKWIPVGAGTPSAGKAEQERVITKNLKPGVHRFLLYLPLFEEVRSLEIGVDEGLLSRQSRLRSVIRFLCMDRVSCMGLVPVVRGWRTLRECREIRVSIS